MSPWYHAMSSSKKFGGVPQDYIEVHNWLDETKKFTGDWTHRALRHHSAGIEEAVQKFNHVIWLKDGRGVPVKVVAEQHVIEDCGFIPTVSSWLSILKANPEQWMIRSHAKSKDLEPQLPNEQP